MKKTKYPLLTRLEIINKKKLIFGFSGGDLYERSKDKQGDFGWADKWEDIHNTLKIVYPLLINLSNDNDKKRSQILIGVFTIQLQISIKLKDLKKIKNIKK